MFMIIGSIIGGAADAIFDSIAQDDAQRHASDQQTAAQRFQEAESDRSRAFTNKWNKKQLRFAREQFQLQKELTTEGIQRRVYDAKQAGLHPLYALGGSISSSPTNFIPGQSPTGSSAGIAVSQARRRGTNFARAGQQWDQRAELKRQRDREQMADTMALEAHLSDLKNDEVLRDRYRSEIRRNEQAAVHGGATGAATQSVPELSDVNKLDFIPEDTTVGRGYSWRQRRDGSWYRAYEEDTSGLGELAPLATAVGVMNDFLADAKGLIRMKRTRARTQRWRAEQQRRARRGRYPIPRKRPRGFMGRYDR